MLHKCCNTDMLGVLLIYPHSPLGAACPRNRAYISVKPLAAVLQPINVSVYVFVCILRICVCLMHVSVCVCLSVCLSASVHLYVCVLMYMCCVKHLINILRCTYAYALYACVEYVHDSHTHAVCILMHMCEWINVIMFIITTSWTIVYVVMLTI